MQEIRERARANLPTVLLTLLSIVQALALEFLWTYVRESPELFALSWINLLTWIQVTTTFLGLVLIWIVYASHVMRLRWVPTTTDSIYPFVIGLLEFMLIETLGISNLGSWMMIYVAIFGLMVWISHRTMRRARLDGQNENFFRSLERATLKDFLPTIFVLSILGSMAVFVRITENQGVFALIGVLAMTAVVLYQFYLAAWFWERSLSDEWLKDPTKSDKVGKQS